MNKRTFKSPHVFMGALGPVELFLIPILVNEELLQKSEDIFDNLTVSVTVIKKRYPLEEDIIKFSLPSLFLQIAKKCKGISSEKSLSLLRKQYRRQYVLMNNSDLHPH